jgi:hypothetical protein
MTLAIDPAFSESFLPVNKAAAATQQKQHKQTNTWPGSANAVTGVTLSRSRGPRIHSFTLLGEHKTSEKQDLLGNNGGEIPSLSKSIF